MMEHMTKRDWLFVALMAPCVAVGVWPVMKWTHRTLMRIAEWLVDWLLAEKQPAPPASFGRTLPTGACLCDCCGHRKAAHEDGVGGCVAEGCDCRGFSGHDAE